MLLRNILIRNYRGLRDVEIPLSRFGCLIGENNAGKSSTLQAVALFFSGKNLAASNFFDARSPIRIELTFDAIAEQDILRLAPEHRARVNAIVKNGRLTLVRLYNVDGKSTLQYSSLAPTDTRFLKDQIDLLMKGGRPGPSFVRKILETFPELDNLVNNSMSQDQMRTEIDQLATLIPDEQKALADLPLPTGIDKSITAMLPDPIYIPAVKDLADDIKTSETTPFGKILSILLPALEAKLPKAHELFREINCKLNRVVNSDGTITDDRLEELKAVEATVAGYVNESFSKVSLRIEIPPPTMKSILSSTLIYADDGVEGLIDSKGDGLRRAIVFSILRAYVELNAKDLLSSRPSPQAAVVDLSTAHILPAPPSYILMFEEPELFLHPKAQSVLFDALRVFAANHQVMVTTHSPMFLGPTATDTFVKLRKIFDPKLALKPFTQVKTVDVSSMAAKDQFQIICFENNNAAFFANTVVLVEGDSDYLLMPHVAKALNTEWDVARSPVIFIRISGKGNIRRYKDFFSRFDVRVPAIVDLDFLVQGFDLIGPTKEMSELRSKLMQIVDDELKKVVEVTGKQAKDALASGELKSLWKQVRKVTEQNRAGVATLEELSQAVDQFYSWQKKTDRNLVLKESTDQTLLRVKHELLEKLREIDVYVLEKGAIEEYYPDSIIGADKPSKAQDFCAKMTTRQLIEGCCGKQTFSRDGNEMTEHEFDLIFRPIFALVP